MAKLLDQMLEVANTLQPGEERVIGYPKGPESVKDGTIVMQIRRVRDEAPEIKSEDNLFVVKLAI